MVRKLSPPDRAAIRAIVLDYRQRLALLPDEPYRTTAALRAEYSVESYQEIGARYGVSVTTISDIISGSRQRARIGTLADYQLRWLPHMPTDVRPFLRDAVQTLRARGLSYEAIGVYFGRSSGWAWRLDRKE